MGFSEAIHDSYELRSVYLPRVWTSVALPDDLSPAKVDWMRVIRWGGMRTHAKGALSDLIAYGRVVGVSVLASVCFEVTDNGFVFSIMFGCTISIASSTSTVRRGCGSWGFGPDARCLPVRTN